MTIRKSCFSAIVGILLSCAWFAAASAQPLAEPRQAAPAFWKVEGKHNTLWLLGSVHVLTKDHYPMAEKVETAFAESPVLIVEADVLNTDPVAMQQALMRTGSLPAGQNLQSFLGAAKFERASELATKQGYNLALMQSMRPWLVSMMIAMNEFAKLGYTPDQGVDIYFLSRAGDEKSVVSLETVEQQLQIFADMQPQVEKDQLLHTLEQLGAFETYLKNMMTAWESGNLGALESVLIEEFAEYPDLYQALVVKRNQNWVQTLKPILENSKQDHFMTVGALHLVGEHSLIDMLRKQGYEVTQQ